MQVQLFVKIFFKIISVFAQWGFSPLAEVFFPLVVEQFKLY